MEKPSPSTCCCRHGAAGDTRRGFFAQAVAVVLGGLALLAPAAVGVVAFLNPLRQKSRSGEFLKITSLDKLPEDGTPCKFSVIADRTDAWNYYRNVSIGAVFLRRDPANKQVEALQVICPHAGCSINYETTAEGGRFFCPCHAAGFDLAGKRTDATSQSPRDMDTLEVKIGEKDEILVKFENFRIGTTDKVALA